MLAADLEDKLKLLLEKHPVFSLLGEAAIQKLVGQLEMVSFRLGEDILVEGEEGNAAFLIFAGRVRVHKNGPAGKPVLLGTLSTGDLFGEHSLIHHGQRMASVRAAEDVVLFRIQRADFERLFDDHPDLAPYFERLMRQRSSSNFLRLATFLGVLPARQVIALLDHLQDCCFSCGEFILQEGEVGDRMYIIKSGQVRVIRGQAKTVLATLGEGDYFGERALILQEPRYASVLATTDVACYSLSRKSFESLVAAAPQVQEQLRRRLEQYHSASVLAQAPELPRSMRSNEKQPVPDLSWEKIGDQPELPASRRRSRSWWLTFLKPFPFVPQEDESDCGAAALAMLGRYHGLDLPPGRLRDLAHVGAEGASMLSLAQAAQASGFSCRAVITDFNHLQGLELPAVAHWRGYHYLVLYEVTGERVVVGDPALGLLKLTRQQFESGWTGRLLLLKPSVGPGAAGGARRGRVATFATRLLPLLAPCRSSVVALILVSLFLAVLPLLASPLARFLMDHFLLVSDSGLLVAIAGGMFVAAGIQVAFVLFRQAVLKRLLSRPGPGSSADWFGRLLKLPLAYFQSRSIGSFLLRLDSSRQLAGLSARLLLRTILDFPMVAVGLAVLFAYQAAGTLLAVVIISLLIVWAFYSFRGWQIREQKAWLQKARMGSALVESIQALETIKGGMAEAPMQRKFAEAAEVGPDGTEWAPAFSGLGAANLLVNAATLCYSAGQVLSGAMTPGELMALQILVALLAVPLLDLAGCWRQIFAFLFVLPKLGEAQEATTEQHPSRQALALPTLRGLIQIDNLSFRFHPESPRVLSQINLVIQPGQIVAIIGRAGAGKTTVAMMLERLLSPSEGSVRIDGFDLQDVELSSLRAQVSVVRSQTVIFAGTVRDNIALADPSTPLDRVIEAAKLANAHDFIMTMPRGYDTLIGPGGLELSAGQCHCLGLARAFWKEPRILVLDDVLHGLDVETEQVLLRNLRGAGRARITILMSRRPLPVSYADSIVVMDQGQVVETGTHDELIAQKGLYYYWTSRASS